MCRRQNRAIELNGDRCPRRNRGSAEVLRPSPVTLGIRKSMIRSPSGINDLNVLRLIIKQLNPYRNNYKSVQVERTHNVKCFIYFNFVLYRVFFGFKPVGNRSAN